MHACPSFVEKCMNTLRPCYTRQFSLQLATQQTLHCQLPKKFHVQHPIFDNCNATKMLLCELQESVAACDTCNTILLKWANQSASFARGRFQDRGRSKARWKLRKKLRTCDILSATCNVFQSSSLRCKLYGKLPRVTWPLLLFFFCFRWHLCELRASFKLGRIVRTTTSTGTG